MEGTPKASPEPPEGEASPQPSERELRLLRQGLLGVHQGSPPALPKEIELLLWYHQLKELGVLESEEYALKKRKLLEASSNPAPSKPASREPAPSPPTTNEPPKEAEVS